MKTKFLYFFVTLALLSMLNVQFSTARAQGTAFTYQGRLNDSGSPAHGNYDFRFKLFEDPFGNNQAGGTVLTNDVPVTNGLFVVMMDFGSGIFNGSNYWLEVDVRTNGAGGYTDLNPLQAVTPTPYAIFANTASNLSGTLSAAQLSGAVSSANLSGTYGSAVTLNNAGNNFSGNGSGLTSLNASQLTSGAVPSAVLSNAWKTAGNAGTAAGANFVGTSDNQPLEIHVNGQRGFRLEPTATNGAVNVIGGSLNNFVASGVVGATIGGGGAGNYSGASYTNRVMFDFGTVGGGFNNVANGFAAVVAGGYNNANNGFAGFIGAGDGNTIVGNGSGDGAFLGGGYSNTNGGEAATLVGGTANFIGAWANNAFIGGGGENSIVGSYVLPSFDTIGGGQYNTIQSNATYATIGGGDGNSIQTNVFYSTIGGGIGNLIQTFAHNAVVAGGTNNVIQSSATNSTIGGGAQNVIQIGSSYGTIGGGYQNMDNGFAATIGGGYQNANNGFAAVVGGGQGNNITGNGGGDGAFLGGGYGNTNGGSAATISGGQGNFIGTFADHSTIGGGSQNSIVGSYALLVSCTIGGGGGNVILTNVSYGTIGGGNQNTNGGTYTTIGGGYQNVNSGLATTIPGGYKNIASGSVSFAAGQYAQATNDGAFVWSDTSGVSTASTNNNSVTMRAVGGFRFFTSTGPAGAQLLANATSWTAISDRNAKKDFAPVNTEAVLDKLARVPVEQWHYKWEAPGDTLNIGPMAQDFKAAFYPGRDDKGISTLEFDGVELAAIQGLNQKLNEKDARINALEKELSELKEAVKKLSDKKE